MNGSFLPADRVDRVLVVVVVFRALALEVPFGRVGESVCEVEFDELAVVAAVVLDCAQAGAPAIEAARASTSNQPVRLATRRISAVFNQARLPKRVEDRKRAAIGAQRSRGGDSERRS